MKPPINCDDCIFLKEEDYGKCNIDACTNPDFADYSNMGKRVPRWADPCRANTGLCGPSAKGFQQKPPPQNKPSIWARLFRLT